MKTYPRLRMTGCHITASVSYVRIALHFPREHAHSCLRQLCGTRWLVALLAMALLLTGCGGETGSNTESDRVNEDERQDVTSESAQDIRIDAVSKGWRPYVVDAKGITALRERAAADGKVLVIDCWATWCGSCVAMFPKLHKAIKERGDGVILASLSFDEGVEATRKAAQFLYDQGVWADGDNAYRAAEGSDATEAIAKALSDNWGGTILPAVFVYRPDGSTAYEFLETRGEVQDWVDAITSAVDEAMLNAEGSAGE